MAYMTEAEFEFLQRLNSAVQRFNPADMREGFERAGQGHVGDEYVQNNYASFVDSPVAWATSRSPIEAGIIMLDLALEKAKNSIPRKFIALERDLIESGRHLDAMKSLRRRTGCSHQEARALLDEFYRDQDA